MFSESCRADGSGAAVISAGASNHVRVRHLVDSAGRPSGGFATGPGLSVVFQDGPRATRDDGRLEPANGAFVEDLLAVARDRLLFFQRAGFRCEENAAAIDHIEKAIVILEERAAGRAKRGVLGTHKA